METVSPALCLPPLFLTSLPPQTSRPWDGSVTRLAILFCWETEAVGGLRVKGGLGGPIDPKWGEVGREELGTWGLNASLGPWLWGDPSTCLFLFFSGYLSCRLVVITF